MTYLVEIKKDYALPLLEVLMQQEAIELKLTEDTVVAELPSRRPATFDAIRVSTKGFKFNRDEANER